MKKPHSVIYVLLFVVATTAYCTNDVRLIGGESIFADDYELQEEKKQQEQEDLSRASEASRDGSKKKPVTAVGYRTFTEPTDSGFHIKILVIRSDGSLVTLWDYLKIQK